MQPENNTVHAEESVVEFGTILKRSSKTASVRVHNPLDQPVSIVRVATGCGCVTARVEPVVIPAQGFTNVEFTAVDPPRTGPLSTHEAMIQCSDGTRLELPVDGHVRELFEAYLVDTEAAQGLLVVSNGGNAFTHDGRQYLTESEHEGTPCAVLIGLDPEQMASIVESGSVAIKTDSEISVRVNTLTQTQLIDTSLPHERLEIGRTTSSDSTQPRLVLLRQGGVAAITQDSEPPPSVSSAR